jgi:O-antigen/teichoic acid export membrane protein
LLFLISRRLFEYCRFSSNLTDKRKILSIFSVSSQVLLPVVSNSVYTHGNQLIVNIFLGAIYNTYLEVCLIWQRLVWTVLNTVGSVIAPQITTYQAKERWDLVAEGLCRVTKYSALIGFPLSAFLTLIPGPILWIWLQQEFNISVSIMPWFSVGLIFLICQIPAASILIALGRYKLPSVVAPILAVINLIVVLICLGPYKLGLESIAISMFICNFIRFGLIQTWYAAKICRCELAKYVYFGYIKPLITILPFTAVLLLSKYYIASWNLTLMIAVIFICALVYIPSCWFLGFDRWDKELAVSHLTSIKSRLTKQKKIC